MRTIYSIAIALLLGKIWANPQSFVNIKSEEIDLTQQEQKYGEKVTNCSCGWTNKVHLIYMYKNNHEIVF